MIFPDLELIWAQSVDRQPVIGINNRLPWHLPEDLKYFQQMTTNQVVIMGRKTWQSLPSRPLRRRLNIVMTSSNDRRPFHGALISNDLTATLRSYSGVSRKLMVIGGYKLFLAAMPLANRLHVTEIGLSVGSQRGQLVYAPDIDRRYWKVDNYPSWQQSPTTGISYRFLSYSRI